MSESAVREIRLLRSMSGVWRRSYGRPTKAPPDERGGNRHGRPNTTAPHPDSTRPPPILGLKMDGGYGGRTGHSGWTGVSGRCGEDGSLPPMPLSKASWHGIGRVNVPRHRPPRWRCRKAPQQPARRGGFYQIERAVLGSRRLARRAPMVVTQSTRPIKGKISL